MSRALGVGGPLRGVLLGALAAGLLLRLWLSWQPIESVDQLLLVDDSYIAFNVSRNLALGRGPLGDSVHATNGYQPLFVWLMVPLFWICDGDRVLPIHLALTGLALANLGCGVVLGRLLARLAGPIAATAGVAYWSLAGQVIQIGLNGLETSLALLLLLASLDRWARASPDAPLRSFAALGGLGGLAVLARIDAVLLSPALFVCEMLRAGIRRALSRGVAVALVAAGVALPWLGYNLVAFGSPLPESGAGTRLQTTFTAGGAPMDGWPWLFRGATRAASSTLVSTMLVLSLMVLVWALYRASRQRLEPSYLVPVAVGLHALLLVGFYVGAVGAYWYFYRYFYPLRAGWALLLGLSIGFVARRLGPKGAAALAACAGLLGASEIPRSLTPRLGGYREIGIWADANLPAGARVAAAQAGSLAYHGDRISVFNVDGKISADARSALAARDLSGYLRRNGIQYVLDWEWNVQKFVVGRSRDSASGLRPLARVETATNGVWRLYALAAPDP